MLGAAAAAAAERILATDDPTAPATMLWPWFSRLQEDRHLGAVPKEHAEKLLAQYQEDGELMPEAAIIGAAEGEAAPLSSPLIPWSDLHRTVM